MGSVRTRRQVKEAESSEDTTVIGTPRANGSITPRSPATTTETENIFLFWPNIVGYARIVLAIGSLYYMPLHPRTCSLLYSISCLLDAADGYLARHFEQSTKFGAVLDMVTDRCTTSCLMVFLSAAWPRWSLVFQCLISLDFASHYMHMYATLTMGKEGGQSHKDVDEKRSWLLHQYYTKKWVLFTLCAGNELFYIALYLLSFSSPKLVPALMVNNGDKAGQAVPSSPAIPINQFMDPSTQAYWEALRANKMDSTVPWILFGISLPLMLVKNWLNGIHLVKASTWLAEGDRADRRAKGLPRAKKE